MSFVEQTLFKTMPCLGEERCDHRADGQEQQSCADQRNNPEPSEGSQGQHQNRKNHDFI